jgi:hypothetical protein
MRPVDNPRKGSFARGVLIGIPGTVRTLLGLNVKSVMVTCPRCGRYGLAMAKWGKRRTVKRIWVFHPSTL